jgi:hypothetical protein
MSVKSPRPAVIPAESSVLVRSKFNTIAQLELEKCSLPPNNAAIIIIAG